MVVGIMGSVRSLVWCLLLMCILIFLFGVCVLQMVTDTLVEADAQGARSFGGGAAGAGWLADRGAGRVNVVVDGGDGQQVGNRWS